MIFLDSWNAFQDKQANQKLKYNILGRILVSNYKSYDARSKENESCLIFERMIYSALKKIIISPKALLKSKFLI